MIYGIMLNPAIDRTQIIPDFSIGRTQKVQSTRVFYAGKGLNVVRTLSLLDYPATCLAFIGRHDLTSYYQTNPKLKIESVPVSGYTRNNITILDPVKKSETHLREPGFTITETDWHNFVEKFTEMLGPGDMVLLSGSLPPGAPADAYARLIRIAHDKRVFSAVDSSGNALKYAVKAMPDLIKINRNELTDWAKASLGDTPICLENAARKLIANGISRAVITDGQTGAWAFSDQEIWQASFSGTIRTGINTVGCGDAFFGGLIAQISEKKSLRDALEFATACGTANTLTPGAGTISADDVDNCLKLIITRKQR